MSVAVSSNTFGVTVGNAPSWVTALALNTWSSHGVNTFDDVKASDIGQYANSGPKSVLQAWCGAALSMEYGDAGGIVHWGGGHLDYYGNEVYVFDLATRTWSRLNDPSAYATGGTISDGIYPDGTPGATHTYYFATGRNGHNVFITTRRETTNQGGGGSYKATIFNLDTLTWFCSTASAGISPVGNGSCYDSTRDCLWMIESDVLGWARYDFDADSWTTYTQPSGAYDTNGGIAYCPTKDCVIVYLPVPGAIRILDPSNPANDSIEMDISGSLPFLEAGSIQWSENLGAFVLYPNKSSNIYTLTPPAGDFTGTWAVVQISISGSASVDSGDAGTYDKAQIVDYYDATILTMISDDTGSYQVVRLS